MGNITSEDERETNRVLGGIANTRAEWFPMGFKSIEFVTDPRFFAASDEGRFWLSDSDVIQPGFRPATALISALRKLPAETPLTFYEEYAIEIIWHEIMHQRTGIITMRIPVDQEPLPEGVIQLAARHTYGRLLNALGGIQNHRETIITDGLAYPRTTRILVELIRRAGVSGGAVETLLLEYGNDWEQPLREKIAAGLGIKAARVGTLFGHIAGGKSLADFIAKLNVQLRNARPHNTESF